MKCQAEFTYIAEELGQLLHQLPDSPEKLQRIAGVVAAMTYIEAALREDELVESYWDQPPWDAEACLRG